MATHKIWYLFLRPSYFILIWMECSSAVSLSLVVAQAALRFGSSVYVVEMVGDEGAKVLLFTTILIKSIEKCGTFE